MKFKVGDKIKAMDTADAFCDHLSNGGVGEITDIDYECYYIDGCWHKISSVEQGAILVSSINKSIMNIKEKFVLALTTEPKKSFRKAGITNGDDLLTDEGSRIFLTWLLHTVHADKFKADVVDGLLAEEKAA